MATTCTPVNTSARPPRNRWRSRIQFGRGLPFEDLRRQGQAPEHAQGHQAPRPRCRRRGPCTTRSGRSSTTAAIDGSSIAGRDGSGRIAPRKAPDPASSTPRRRRSTTNASAFDVEHVEGPAAAAQQHGLGEDLGHPGLAGDDGGEGEVGVRRSRRWPDRSGGGRAGRRWSRPASACVDVATAPALKPRRASGSDADGCSMATVHAVAVGRLAGDPQVAAEVDAHAGGAGGEHLGDDQVGGQSLADAARIEARCRPGRRTPAAVDRDVRAAREQRARIRAP